MARRILKKLEMVWKHLHEALDINLLSLFVHLRHIISCELCGYAGPDCLFQIIRSCLGSEMKGRLLVPAIYGSTRAWRPRAASKPRCSLLPTALLGQVVVAGNTIDIPSRSAPEDLLSEIRVKSAVQMHYDHSSTTDGAIGG